MKNDKGVIEEFQLKQQRRKKKKKKHSVPSWSIIPLDYKDNQRHRKCR